MSDDASALRDAASQALTAVDAAALASSVCGGVERELAAIETRLAFFHSVGALARGEAHASASGTEPAAALGDSSSPTIGDSAEPLRPRPRARRRQYADQVADEVESALRNCDQLLARARRIGAAARTGRACCSPGLTSPSWSLSSAPGADGVASTSGRSVHEDSRATTRDELDVDDEPDDDQRSEPSLRSCSSEDFPARVRHYSGVEDASSLKEQQALERKARLVRSLARRGRRETQREADAMREQHARTLVAYLDELRRRYESKKGVALLTLRERYERETKAAVRQAMEAHEQQQEEAVEALRASLTAERREAMRSVREAHEKRTTELLARAETELRTEALREQEAIEKQLDAERDERVKALESEHHSAMAQWAADKKLALEQEAVSRREEAAMAALREQEAKTREMVREVEQRHDQSEREELQKLRKALAFGAQAQLQQLRRRLQAEHDEKMSDTRTEAALEMERKTDELTQLLSESHRAQREKLARDLDTQHRVALMDLQDRMQKQHEARVQVMNADAATARAKAVRERQAQLEVESCEALDALEAALERESSAKIQQMQAEGDAECAQSLETLRHRFVQAHANELEAKISRMQQCRRVLLAEAKELLMPVQDAGRNEIKDTKRHADANEVVGNLTRLRTHLPGELAKYVDIVVDEFLDIAEEQRVLVAKITDVTQLYLTFKRRCAALEERAGDYEHEVAKLRERVRGKDAVCKKLQSTNEVLMSRPLRSGNALDNGAAARAEGLSTPRQSQ